MNRQTPNLREELPGVFAVAVAFVILAYYGKWAAGIGVVLAAIGGKLMAQYGRRDSSFFLGVLVGLAGLVIFLWGMF